jgi:Flp pilus assembly pilin Flp
MKLITCLYVRLRGAVSGIHGGQTLGEYALIFVCIAIALIGGYQLIGANLASSVSGVNSQVSNA